MKCGKFWRSLQHRIMKIFRGFHHAGIASQCALTVGNFDGVHRGHQAMIALLRAEAARRGIPSCALTFEPHPRDYFAKLHQKSELAPMRVGTLRDKLQSLSEFGLDQVVILPFNEKLSSLNADEFIRFILVRSLGIKYVLVGDDFRFGRDRCGDYALLDQFGARYGYDVARMNSYEVHSKRVSSTEVREALSQGNLLEASTLLGHPYRISGHVLHGRKLGRLLGFRTLNLRFSHWKPAASGIFIVQVHGLSDKPLRGIANLGVRPSLDPNDINGGRVLLETHCLDWPEYLGLEGGYGKIVGVDLLHKLHDERIYADLETLRIGIAQDYADAEKWFLYKTILSQ
jgi:riboflavin kinase / FMN adenylyltransferase